jgi:hypothetical protein
MFHLLCCNYYDIIYTNPLHTYQQKILYTLMISIVYLDKTKTHQISLPHIHN